MYKTIRPNYRAGNTWQPSSLDIHIFFFSPPFSSPPLRLREVDFSHSGDNLAAVAHHARQSLRVIVGEIEQMRKPNPSCILYSCPCSTVVEGWECRSAGLAGWFFGRGGRGTRSGLGWSGGGASCALTLSYPPQSDVKTRRGPSLNVCASTLNGAQAHMDLVVSETANHHLAVDVKADFLSCEFTTWHFHHTHQTSDAITCALQRRTILHSSK